MRHPLISSASIATAALLFLSGCASDTPAEPLDPEKSPLMSISNALYGAYDEKEWVEKTKQQEELIAECMSEAGFEYTPVDYSTTTDYSEAYEGQGTEKWAATYGYGINTEVIPAEEMDNTEDPNSEYVQSLSESESTAYYSTLYGDQTYTEETLDENGDPIDDGGGVAMEYNWEENGCSGQASHEIYDSKKGDPAEDPEFKTLIEEMNSLREVCQGVFRQEGCRRVVGVHG
ncbi:hypothetical protein GCM10022198_25020 [Klugiella xanthotipulae]|uniref:hypothetical protein n=1 Tax=Klugiella xanthotipulae TaxID=244735 RepID=UPI001152FC32|nr:hypothetical protein [Klugiella xanthotipulae]